MGYVTQGRGLGPALSVGENFSLSPAKGSEARSLRAEVILTKTPEERLNIEKYLSAEAVNGRGRRKKRNRATRTNMMIGSLSRA